jgi:hypothetical protein
VASSWLGDATSLLARCLVTFGVVVDADGQTDMRGLVTA